MGTSDEGDTLSAPEVMRLLHISHTTLAKWRARGILVPIPTSPTLKRPYRRYRRTDVEKHLPKADH